LNDARKEASQAVVDVIVSEVREFALKIDDDDSLVLLKVAPRIEFHMVAAVVSLSFAPNFYCVIFQNHIGSLRVTMKIQLENIFYVAFGAVVGSLLTLFLMSPLLFAERFGQGAASAEIKAGMIQGSDEPEQSVDMGYNEWTDADTRALLDQVSVVQKEFVQESWGVGPGEFYTENDYLRFKRTNQVVDVVDAFASSDTFQRLRPKLGVAKVEAFNDLIGKIRAQYQRTWSAIGRVDRSAQTDSGQKAQKDISNAIANFIQQMRPEL
jgi:hypothetical protein